MYEAEDIRSLLGIPVLDVPDMKYVLEKMGVYLLHHDRNGRALQVVDSTEFKDWILEPKSKKLLVEADYTNKYNYTKSPLTVFCASLTQALRGRSDCISLVFFCGEHDVHDAYPGPVNMIRSFIDQLLWQDPTCIDGLSQDVALDRVRTGDFKELCNLFSFLVRKIPSHITIFCVLDHIQVYDHRDQYRPHLMEAVQVLLDLAEHRDPGPQATMKIFFTSPIKPSLRIQEFFDWRSSRLNLKTIHRRRGEGCLRTLQRKLRELLE